MNIEIKTARDLVLAELLWIAINCPGGPEPHEPSIEEELKKIHGSWPIKDEL